MEVRKLTFFVCCVLKFIFLVTQARTNGLEGAFGLPWNMGGGKLEKNPILWLAVTQGMGQGRVRGERMTLVAIVHWKDEDFCTSFHYSFTVRGVKYSQV